jgi:protocatechuate 3,4-dioxygenase beta subunit
MKILHDNEQYYLLRKTNLCPFCLIITSLLFLYLFNAPSQGNAKTCPPTEPDVLGPFYKPGSPEHSAVGKGYVLGGKVKSSIDCSPLKGAKIEFWLAGPDGRYGDDFRATVISGKSGDYHFESYFPPSYASRPPHIHIRVSARGYRALVTQHYPQKDTKEGHFDLVLIPENQR